MSRGRGGRGGRGGASRSFNREQLSAMGVTNNEMIPTLVTQPPPLFPLMERRPVPLTQSIENDYMLILRQDFVDHMQLSAAYLKMPESKTTKPEQEIEKLVAQMPSSKEKYDWTLFPVELRPKVLAKRVKKNIMKKDVDVQERLKALEQLEESKNTTVIKEEDEAVEDEETAEVEDDQQDEEMDDGTDYANNYFDNGEGYEDDDDNMDEGPIY